MERFAVFAEMEIARCPETPRGICARPDCSARFKPTRIGQVYCSSACQRADDDEFRNIGAKIARAALAWRMGKHAPNGSARKDLSNSGFRYLGRALTEWVEDRDERREAQNG